MGYTAVKLGTHYPEFYLGITHKIPDSLCN